MDSGSETKPTMAEGPSGDPVKDLPPQKPGRDRICWQHPQQLKIPGVGSQLSHPSIRGPLTFICLRCLGTSQEGAVTERRVFLGKSTGCAYREGLWFSLRAKEKTVSCFSGLVRSLNLQVLTSHLHGNAVLSISSQSSTFPLVPLPELNSLSLEQKFF